MGPVYNGSCTRRPIAASTSTEWIEIDCQYLVHTSTHVFAHDDRFVGAYGHLNACENAELLRMDTGSSDIFFLERSWDRQYIKADIFDHPTAFSQTALRTAETPLEALSASLNKYGEVRLAYMASLLPEQEEDEIGAAHAGSGRKGSRYDKGYF